MKPHGDNEPGEGVFSAATAISDAPSWFSSLVKFIETKSPIGSLFTEIRELIHDTFHPRKIESSVAPVEVEEIWSKPTTGLPRLLSLGVHVLIVVLALVPWATQPNITKANE